MRLVSAKEYVTDYGVVETGRLLTNKHTISPSTTDDRASYVAAMFVGDNEANDLEPGIEDAINIYIDAGQDEIQPELQRFLKWPLQKDGLELSGSEIPTIIRTIVKEAARWYFHDEDVRSVEEISYIERRYKRALEIARQIGDGEMRVQGVDEIFTKTVQFVI